MSSNDVYTFNYDPVFTGKLPFHSSGFTFFFSGNHQHSISSPNTHYTTSGAKDTIRMKPRSLSSRATGPNIRVPLGNWFSAIKTAALSSNLM